MFAISVSQERPQDPGSMNASTMDEMYKNRRSLGFDGNNNEMDPTIIVPAMRVVFKTGKTLPLEWRIKQLKAIQSMLTENKELFCSAVYEDMHKCHTEAISTEVDFVLNEVRGCLRDIHRWVKPKPMRKQFMTVLDGVMVKADPYGVALVMGSWNYPINLLLTPMCGALAAGNCVILKPSELSPFVAKLIGELVPQYLDSDCVKVYNGGIPETTELLKERFDYIFYTGSTTVGRIIHAAATKHLTPVTLELGGKSPVYVAEDANLTITAKRILWGKLLNCGQTCIAPDYILCSRQKQQMLVAEMVKYLKDWHGANPQDSKDWGRIINERHFDRIVEILKTTTATVAHGGTYNKSDLYINPTLLTNVDASKDTSMREEIFGPVLPFVTVNSAQEAVDFINEREKPLALYVFSDDKATQKLFTERTSSGGLVFNELLLHIGVESLPFGGVGESGMGAYHGDASFETFSHIKAVYTRDLGQIGEAASAMRYPPYNSKKDKMMELLSTNRTPIPATYSGVLLAVGTFFLGAATSVVFMFGSLKDMIF